MKFRTIMLIPIIAATAITVEAQQALFGGQDIKSPEIHPDRSVTFRVTAPEAGEVKITGEWLPAEGWMPGSVSMQKDEDGLWTYTTEPLDPELYTYAILVDGFRTTDPNNVYQVRDIATLSSFFIVPGDNADLYRVQQVTHGSLTRRWYDSPGNNSMRRIAVYTPPGYESGNRKYPVLYLLHGAGGDEEAWVTLGRATQILDNMIASGKVQPMIVVMPNGNVSQEAAPGEGSEGFYKPSFMMPRTMDGSFESTFPDIIQFVEKNYRVIRKKSHRAIAGLSMGGYHALHISRYYPNTFEYIGLFSAAILPPRDTGSAVYAEMEATLQQQRDNGYRLYWVGCGKTDFLYNNVLEFKAQLDVIRMPYVWRESEGGHTWRNWRMYLTEFLPMLFLP